VSGSNWTAGRVTFTAKATLATPRPAPDRAILQAIQDRLRAGDIVAATALADEALAAGHEQPFILNLVAERRERAGLFDEALALLERAQALAPEDFSVRQALGLCLYRLERYRSALEQFDAVLAVRPDFAPGHAGRGMALEALGDLTGAQAAWEQTLRLQPGHLQAIAGMALLASRRGDHEEARPLAETVLAAAPGYPDAVMTLASADLAAGQSASAEARLREMLTAPERMTPMQAALAQGLLGDVLDAEDRAGEAFDAYSDCNGQLRDLYRGRYETGPSVTDDARALVAAVDAAPAGAWTRLAQASSSSARSHVFLVGFPRSGTTLLEQALVSHPDVESLEERDTLADAVEAYLSPGADPGRLAAAPEAELSRLRAAYWARVAEEGGRPQGKVFIDKYPLNTLKLPLIAKLFPDARILFAQRDPRDVVLSCFRRRFGMNRSMYQFLTLYGAAALYDVAMQFGERLLGGTIPLSTYTVRHETLVEDFDGVAGGLCDFLGIPRTDAMRDFAQRTRDRGIATPSAAQLARGLNAEGVGAWRRYREPMATVMPILAPWVERFGYPAD
jgi:tetratricopeptide (TPR) repeat protein